MEWAFSTFLLDGLGRSLLSCVFEVERVAVLVALKELRVCKIDLSLQVMSVLFL